MRRLILAWPATAIAATLGMAGALQAQTAPPAPPPAVSTAAQSKLAPDASSPADHGSFGGKAAHTGLTKEALALAREEARVAATQNYAIHPAIWKIGDADTTIYIFGTIHSLPPGFRWRNSVLESAIDKSDALIVETTAADDDDITFLEGLSGDAKLPPLIDRVTHRSRAKLAALQARMTDEGVVALDKLPSWVAALDISDIRQELAGDISSEGADDWLETHFRAANKKVEAIEDGKSVIASINAVPERAQRLMLEDALLAPDPTHEELDASAHAWAQGNVGPGSPLLIEEGDLDPSGALNDPMLARRNAAWVTKLATMIRERPGTIFFAAGAGHFMGKGSVLDLLRKRGVRVERVQ